MSLVERPARSNAMSSPAYRELWSTDRGERRITICVYLDGSEKIEESPDLTTAQVRALLKSGQFHFVRLLKLASKP